MLSLTCKTAIKAVIYLAARFESGERSGMKQIAEVIEASEHTVGKILQELVKHEVIKSLKGPNGGFYMTAAQRNQPVIKIVEAIDGKEVFKQCGLGLSKCSSSHPCPIHDEYKVVRDLFERMCRDNTINDLCKPVNKGVAYLIG
jgi:Rrf2 family protein